MSENHRITIAAARWLIELEDDRCTDESRTMFAAWFRSDIAHRTEYMRLEEQWSRTLLLQSSFSLTERLFRRFFVSLLGTDYRIDMGTVRECVKAIYAATLAQDRDRHPTLPAVPTHAGALADRIAGDWLHPEPMANEHWAPGELLELSAAIEQVVRSLSRHCLNTLCLWKVHGNSVCEISATLGIEEESVRENLQLAAYECTAMALTLIPGRSKSRLLRRFGEIRCHRGHPDIFG